MKPENNPSLAPQTPPKNAGASPVDAAPVKVQSAGIRPSDTPERIQRVIDWAREVEDLLRLEGVPCEVEEILALSTDIAHQVARPAVPVTSYLIGAAVGAGVARGRDGAAEFQQALVDVLKRVQGRSGEDD